MTLEPPGGSPRTPTDPQGSPAAPAPNERPAFVLHEHRKPRHHYDLRLEVDGVLRSWALPKGLPDHPLHDRLAVPVPDHEMAHLAYVDKDKSIADTGWWEQHDANERRFVFTLHGRSTDVRYALIHTGDHWLLHRLKQQS
jgi:DNA ligase D-like protein (predicted 3'-phosphoesterase)